MFIYGAPGNETAYLVPAYQVKEQLPKVIERLAAQTIGEPIDIILSDHGSTDGTRKVIRDAYYYYKKNKQATRHNICGYVAQRNKLPAIIAAVHDHVNQLVYATDNRYYILGTADDDDDITRAERVVDIFKSTGAGFVTNSQKFIDAKTGETQWFSKGTGISRWVQLEETITAVWDHPSMNGSSAWTRPLWDTFGPLGFHAANDIIMPVWGCLGDGTYHIGDVLKTYFITGQQTGLGARYKYAKGLKEKTRIQELMCFERSCIAEQMRKLVGEALQRAILAGSALPANSPASMENAHEVKRLQRCFAITSETVIKRAEEWNEFRSVMVREGIAPHNYRFTVNKHERDNVAQMMPAEMK